MKTSKTLLLAAAWLAWAAPVRAQETPGAPETKTAETKPAGETRPAPGELRLNFRNAPLDMVLDYLSEAAGFTIVLETQVKGTIDVWSNHPVPVQEALDILDSALARNGYTAIRDGRKLTIVSKEAATTRNIPIVQSSDWDTIPQSDVVATYIIPVRYINATQLITTLQPLTPDKMQITANADSNSLLITDSQAAIRRIAHITSLLDSSVSSVSEVKVIPLKHADAKEMAETVTSLYANQNRNSRGNNNNQGGRGGNFQFPGGGGGGRGN